MYCSTAGVRNKDKLNVNTQEHQYLEIRGDGAMNNAYQASIVLCIVFSIFSLFVIINLSFQAALLFLLVSIIALLCVINFEIGIMLLFLAAPVTIIGERVFGDYKLYLATFTLLLWVIRKAYKKESIIDLLKHPITPFIIAFTALGFFSVLASSDMKVSLKFLLKHCGNLVFFFVFADIFKTRKIVYNIIFCLLLASFFESLYGIFEFAINLKTALPSLYRSKGTFYHPNIFGRYLSVVFIFLVALILDTKNKRRFFIYLAAGATILSAILISFSRSALLGILIGCFFLVPMYFNLRAKSVINRSMITLFFIANIIFVIILSQASSVSYKNVLPSYEKGLGVLFEKASIKKTFLENISRQLARENIWSGSMKMVLDHPILGYGVGMIAPASVNYLELDYLDLEGSIERIEKEGVVSPDQIANAHNLFLHVMVEMGAGGVILMLWLYYIIFTHVKKNLGLVKDSTQRVFLLGGTACVVNDLFMGFFEPANMFGPGSLGFLFVFFASLIFAAPEIQ